MAEHRGLIADTDTVLYFVATQEARLATMRRANELAATLVQQAEEFAHIAVEDDIGEDRDRHQPGKDQGQVVEDASKDQFFTQPKSDRAIQFLSKILQH